MRDKMMPRMLTMVGAVALALWLVPASVYAQKCCECGATRNDEDSTVVCFNEPNSNSECSTVCGTCSLEVSEFNANTPCDEGAPAPRCAGRTYENPGTGGENCPDAPDECEIDDDCDDSNDCTTDTCDGGSCSNVGISCPGNNPPCTSAICLVDGGCDLTYNEGETCNDFDSCTENDVCDDAGACAGTPIENCVPSVRVPAASNRGLMALAASLFVLAVVVLRRRSLRT